MTGPEHFTEADLILTGDADPCSYGCPHNGCPHEMAMLARAQVHATLALAAATALSRYNFETGFVEADRRAWYVAASEGPGEKQRQREAEQAEAAEFAQEAGNESVPR